MTETMNPVIEIAQKARIASYELAQLNRDIKDKALQNMADALITNSETITKADKDSVTRSTSDIAIALLHFCRIKNIKLILSNTKQKCSKAIYYNNGNIKPFKYN